MWHVHFQIELTQHSRAQKCELCSWQCSVSGFGARFVPPLLHPVLHLNAALIVSWMPQPQKGFRWRLSQHLWPTELYLCISVSPPQWAPGPENSYLAGQDPLKWPFLATAAIQAGWEDTKEDRATQGHSGSRSAIWREGGSMHERMILFNGGEHKGYSNLTAGFWRGPVPGTLRSRSMSSSADSASTGCWRRNPWSGQSEAIKSSTYCCHLRKINKSTI